MQIIHSLKKTVYPCSIIMEKIIDPCSSCRNNVTCKRSKKCSKFSDYILKLELLNENAAIIDKSKLVIAVFKEGNDIYSLKGNYDPSLYCILAMNLLHEVNMQESDGNLYIDSVKNILTSE